MIQTSEKDPIMYAAFMMEGLCDLADVTLYSRTIEAWNKGCYELVDCMTNYVPFLVRLVNAKLADAGGWPGILEYDVCNGFGSWFGAEVLRTGEAPIETEAHAKLAQLVNAFFGDDGGYGDGDAS